MIKKTLITLTVGAVISACGGGGNNNVANAPGSVALSGFDGAPSVGETALATVSDPDGVVVGSETFGWYANGQVIAGATTASYTVTAEDIGKTLRAIAHYRGNNGVTESAGSAETEAVPASVALWVTFIHGLVHGANCAVYPLSQAGGQGPALAEGTSSQGVLNLAAIEHQGPALVACSGGTYTDEATGLSLTAPMTRAVTALETDRAIVVSPLTELAVQLAEANSGGLLTALSQHNDNVAQRFGLVFTPAGATASTWVDITRTVPTDLQSSAAEHDESGLYAGALALISQLDANLAGDAASVVAQLATDLNDGSFSVPTLQQLASAAADLGASPVASNLNQAAMSAIASGAGYVNSEGSVVVTGSPSIGSTVRANVTDPNGVGSVSYQWLRNGIAIEGASSSALVVLEAFLGDTLSVQVTYTDNAGFSESHISTPTPPVSTDASNFAGEAGSVSGVRAVGEILTVSLPTDQNGISGTVSYQWLADEQSIAAANAPSYLLTVDEVGKRISVTASYTDDDGFAESVTATANGIVFSEIVSGKAALASAVSSAMEGAFIGVQEGDYANMAELNVTTNNVTLMAVEGQVPVISGTTCIVLGNGAVLDGMTFSNLTLINGSNCATNGESSVYMSGDRVTLRNNTFTSMVPGLKYNYVSLKGFQSVIERNSFAGKDVNQDGGYISMFANSDVDSNEGHEIRYNHFRDSVSPTGNAGDRNSSGYAVQIGRSTGNDGKEDGLTTVKYNLFTDVMIDRRLIKVQSSRNTIHGNTIVNSTGMIALEDGYGSTASSNIILSGGEDADDGGISFAQLGHTVIDNYMNNLRTSSSQRAGLMINADPLSGDGNKALLADSSLDFTLSIARNTIVNARQAIQFEDADCNQAGVKTILDMDANLVANFDSTNAINPGSTNGSGRDVVTDSDFLAKPCVIDASSDYDNNHFYSAALSESGAFDFKLGQDGNMLGAENGATLTAPNANNMVEGTGADQGIGADIDGLIYLNENMVGPGTSWRE